MAIIDNNFFDSAIIQSDKTITVRYLMQNYIISFFSVAFLYDFEKQISCCQGGGVVLTSLTALSMKPIHILYFYSFVSPTVCPVFSNKLRHNS